MIVTTQTLCRIRPPSPPHPVNAHIAIAIAIATVNNPVFPTRLRDHRPQPETPFLISATNAISLTTFLISAHLCSTAFGGERTKRLPISWRPSPSPSAVHVRRTRRIVPSASFHCSGIWYFSHDQTFNNSTSNQFVFFSFILLLHSCRYENRPLLHPI